MRRAAFRVGRMDAAAKTDGSNPDGLAAKITRELLANPDDRDRLARIVAECPDPDAAAALYLTRPVNTWADEVFTGSERTTGGPEPAPGKVYELAEAERRKRQAEADAEFAAEPKLTNPAAAGRAALRGKAPDAGRATGGAS